MSFALLAAALLATPATAPSTPINGRDPIVLEHQLREMGYAPTAFNITDASATGTIEIGNDQKLTIVLAGCTKSTACTYIVALGVYTDVVRPPASWVAQANKDYDLIKVWLRDDGSLTYSDGGVVDGMSRATFKAWIDGIKSSAADLAARANKDKLIKTN